ncbi:MAG: DotU family type IV/VI secretion system protein [Gammaproteobacteria bacterium]|nr:DotU family type IV/VI secretion system protein [Gammaproteobacteria bacterium]
MANDNSTEYPGDDDRTIFIPKPSGRGPASMASPPPSTPPPPAPPSPPLNYNNPHVGEFTASGVNPLVSAAAGLLALPPQFLTMASHSDVAGLRNQVLEEIKTFENNARLLGINPDVTYTSRYILCTYIDEAVLNTIWGSSSSWASQSLLSTLHNETSGGETFFVILDKLLRDTNASLELIELMFICISLGFKGSYAVMDRGHEKLEELRNIVFEHIRRRRGEFPQELSPHWQSQSNQRTSLRNSVPLWVVVAVASALLLVIFFGFTLVLDETADPVYEALEDVARLPTVDLPID